MNHKNCSIRLTDVENRLVVTSGEREGKKGSMGVGGKGLLWDYIKLCV